MIEEDDITRLWGPKVTRPGTIEGRGHAEAPPENPNRPVVMSEGRTFNLPGAVAIAEDPERRQ